METFNKPFLMVKLIFQVLFARVYAVRRFPVSTEVKGPREMSLGGFLN